MLMPNKWICGATYCGLIGVIAALLYLLAGWSQSPLLAHNPQQPDWLILLFCSMLGLSVLLNAIAFFGSEISPSSSWWRPNLLKSLEPRQQLDHFFQQHASQLQQLSPAADLFLWSDGEQRHVIKLCTRKSVMPHLEPVDYGDVQQRMMQMRQLLQSKAKYQCQHAYWLSAEPVDLIAKIFARESGIKCLQFSELGEFCQTELPSLQTQLSR